MNKYHLIILHPDFDEDVIVEATTLITTQGAYMFHSSFDKADSENNIIVACYPVQYTIIRKVEREG